MDINFETTLLCEEIDDPNIKAAVQEVIDTGSTLPLTKRIVHDTIQIRRMDRGLPELVQTTKKREYYELTEEEEIKRKCKKELNKKAAKKYRQKQKECHQALLWKINDLEEKNKNIASALAQERMERADYHICRNCCNHTTYCKNDMCKVFSEE
ncbi:uncharacterized protein LOC126811706 [Patella vulgata]|uniref:uncharacterized protein LOC126811706 n=1 Tax=Patella vulgata TaxID=6465 RepID=UPI00217FD9FA|nr:uncharacterized protein LOC126811706 [Patella vulgata]